MDEDVGYVCSLNAAGIQKAKEELYEDPNDRLSSVKAFRKWVLDQPHIRCRTDTQFLLKYLRGAKFSQLRARELLENTMTIMTKIPTWFKGIDTHSDHIQEYMKLGACFPLPKRDQLNRRILVIRPGAVPVNNRHYSLENEMRHAYVISSYIGWEEETQVYGFILLFDFTGHSMKHMKRWSIEDSKKQSKVWQDCTPGRVKSFHFYNAGTFFEMFMGFMRPFMKKKFQDRIKVHDTLESLYKCVPQECLPSDYLPDDYSGPHVGSIQSIIEDMVKNIGKPDYNALILNSTKPEFGMDIKSKPDVIQESFRKLNVD